MATLRLRIVSNARCSEVAGAYGDGLKVKVQAPALEGKANEALLAFLAAKLGVPRGAVTLIAGAKSRDKIAAIEGLSDDEARERLLA